MSQDYATITKYAVIGGAVLAALYVLNKAGQIVTETATVGGGLITGNNAITSGARTDAYSGSGVVGTLGAATDRALGGAPSRLGEWLGGKAADIVDYWSN